MTKYAEANPVLAAGPARSSVDPAWRTAAVGQILRSTQGGAPGCQQLCGATVLLDISKFFDVLPASTALDLALRGGIPAWMIRCAFSAHSWDRHLR